MVIIITGSGHTGKTLLAQRLLEKYKYPYLSIDHLKMGLIRSGNTTLTPLSDTASLTEYLWPIVSEMIKTAIENKQNLIVEGCYIPIDWADAFSSEYMENIRLICLIMSENYIENHFDDVVNFSSVIESRLCDDISKEWLIKENEYYRKLMDSDNCQSIVFDDGYNVLIDEI